MKAHQSPVIGSYHLAFTGLKVNMNIHISDSTSAFDILAFQTLNGTVRGSTRTETTPPWAGPLVTIRMSCFTTGDPGKE